MRECENARMRECGNARMKFPIHAFMHTFIYALKHIQHQPGFFAHLVLGPGWVIDNTKVNFRDAIYFRQSLLDFHGEDFGDGAHGGSQGHADPHKTIIPDIDLVDQPQFVNIDRDLGVVNGF